MHMNRTVATLWLSCVMLCHSTAAIADLEDDAANAARRGDFAAAVSAYQQLLENNPTSISLRLELADALAKDRQWDRAIEEYQKVLKRQPKSIPALLGIGTVRRWQGNIAEAKLAYEQVLALSPQDAAGLQGMAATYALDHDYVNAEKYYAQAEKLWPGDSSVKQAAYDFHRQRNLRAYVLWETDLSFQTHQAGAVLPFGAREEIGAEYQDESSFYVPQTGGSRLLIYTRTDRKIFYTHYFGINNMLDLSARTSAYQYHVPDTALGFATIDTYQEYRARYTTPLTQDQVFSVRYTLRPTILKFSNGSFNSHKLEAELNSRWLPEFSTQLGLGLLRDLDSNAVATSQLTDRSLVKAGFQWDVTARFSVGAKYITNPDLDNTMRATSITEAAYSVTEVWSVLGRYRTDSAKVGADQTEYYFAVRFVPNSSWWSEFGVKHAKRDAVIGNYGLASISIHF